MFIRESKTDAGVRCLPIMPDVKKILLDLKKKGSHSDNYVFHTTRGTPISEFSLHKLYLRMRKATEIQTITNHVYRHTYATRAIENGMGISALAKILGHTDLSFTAKRYVHPEFEFIKKEMEASENRRGARRNSRQETVQILRV